MDRQNKNGELGADVLPSNDNIPSSSSVLEPQARPSDGADSTGSQSLVFSSYLSEVRGMQRDLRIKDIFISKMCHKMELIQTKLLSLNEVYCGVQKELVEVQSSLAASAEENLSISKKMANQARDLAILKEQVSALQGKNERLERSNKIQLKKLEDSYSKYKKIKAEFFRFRQNYGSIKNNILNKVKRRITRIAREKNHSKIEEHSRDCRHVIKDKGAYWANLIERASKIPSSNGSEVPQILPLKVGIITDEFMYNYYSECFESVIYVSPKNYKETLNSDLDALIFVSCWYGMDGNDWRGLHYLQPLKQAFSKIMNICRENSIATIFQSIEDPSNYNRFLPFAKQCDYIFTSDRDIIDQYKIDCDNDNVFWGEYGVNPGLNNTMGLSIARENGYFFAGSYPAKYKERCDDMNMIFDAIVSSQGKLVVADRNSDQIDTDFKFPEKYKDYIIDKFDHKTLQKIHKLFRFNLNLNSIKKSTTMCAMRIYELQAQGELLISNWARSLELLFPNVEIITKKTDLIVDDFVPSSQLNEYFQRVKVALPILASKTAYQQSCRMFSRVGLNFEVDRLTVYVVLEQETPKLRKMFERQTFVDKVLMTKEEFFNLDLGENEFFTFFSEDLDYASDYLQDMVNGFKFTRGLFVTKNSFVREGKFYKWSFEDDYTNTYLSVYRTLFSSRIENCLNVKRLADFENCSLKFQGYSTNPFFLEEGEEKDTQVSVVKIFEEPLTYYRERPSIYFLYSGKYVISASWSGAAVNAINEMYILSKNYDVYYNDIYLNDLFLSSGLLLEKELIARFNKAYEAGARKLSSLPKVFKPSRKYAAYFYRGVDSEDQNKFFLNELGAPKIYGHNFVREVWNSSIVGFQNKTSLNFCKDGKLKELGDDGTLNYSSIEAIPKRSFIRHQGIVGKCFTWGETESLRRKVRERNKNPSELVFGICGTLTDKCSPVPHIKILERARDLFPELNITLKIYALHVLVDIPSKDWIEVSSYSKLEEKEAISEIDVLINPWHTESQLYSASNKILEAMKYSVPILTPRTESREEQLGEAYELFHDFEQTEACFSDALEVQILSLIKKCTDESFRKRVGEYLTGRQEFWNVSHIAKLYHDQVCQLRKKSILYVSQSLGIGGVEQYSIDMIRSFPDADANIFTDIEVPVWRKEQLADSCGGIKYFLPSDDLEGEFFDTVVFNSWPVVSPTFDRMVKSIRSVNPNAQVMVVTHTDIHDFNRVVADNLRLVDKHITVSPPCTEKISQYSNRDISGMTILNQPCLPEFSDVFKLKDERSHKIGYVGRAVPVKGVHSLVGFFVKYLQERPETPYVLEVKAPFQNDSYFMKVVEMVPARHLGKRIILENVSMKRSEVVEVLRNLDFLVYTSAMDGLPYTFLEAMSMGTPVISTSVGGIETLIKTGCNGFLLEFEGLFVKDLSEKYPYNVLVDLLDRNQETYYKVFRRILDEAFSLTDKEYESMSSEAYAYSLKHYSHERFKKQMRLAIFDS